jgi:hypothetical protein
MHKRACVVIEGVNELPGALLPAILFRHLVNATGKGTGHVQEVTEDASKNEESRECRISAHY